MYGLSGEAPGSRRVADVTSLRSRLTDATPFLTHLPSTRSQARSTRRRRQAMRPGRGTPPMTVTVVASDPLTADDIVTALRTHPQMRVLGHGQAAQAEAMLVLVP